LNQRDQVDQTCELTHSKGVRIDQNKTTEGHNETTSGENTLNNKELEDLKAENIDLKHQMMVKDSLVNYYSMYINEINSNLLKIQGKQNSIFEHQANPEMLSADNQTLVGDIEQLGLSLTSTNDVMGRSIASSSLVTVGSNNRLTNINLSTFNVEMEPVKNLRISVGSSLRTLSSALPDAFSLDYVDPTSPTGISSEIKQFDLNTTVIYTPGKRTIGYGVERVNVNDDYSTLVLNYTKGMSGFLESDFDYEKIQFSYRQPWQIGGLGRLTSSVELQRHL